MLAFTLPLACLSTEEGSYGVGTQASGNKYLADSGSGVEHLAASATCY